MSHNIPFEIQVEIIKNLPAKSVIRFQSVCKNWNSLIRNPNFKAHIYSPNIHHLLAPYLDPLDYTRKYVLITDNDTFPRTRLPVPVPRLVNMLKSGSSLVGSSSGILCLYGYVHSIPETPPMAVIWNVSINKAVAVVVPNVLDLHNYDDTFLAFGVCRETSDPKIVKTIYYSSSECWQVEVFTLSTGVWRRLYNNLPCRTIRFGDGNYCRVVIDGVVYRLASNWCGGGGSRFDKLIVSFDLTSEEFRQVNLPDCLACSDSLSVCKLRESLVVLQSGVDGDDRVAHVWMMEGGVTKSFKKVFVVDVYKPDAVVLGFRKSGQLILEVIKRYSDGLYGKPVVVYDPCSKYAYDLGINGFVYAFYVYPYMETLLLLDHPDFIIYDKGKRRVLKSGDELRDERKEPLENTSKGKIFGFFFNWLKPKRWIGKR